MESHWPEQGERPLSKVFPQNCLLQCSIFQVFRSSFYRTGCARGQGINVCKIGMPFMSCVCG